MDGMEHRKINGNDLRENVINTNLPGLRNDRPIPPAFNAKSAIGLALLRDLLCKFKEPGDENSQRSATKERV